MEPNYERNWNRASRPPMNLNDVTEKEWDSQLFNSRKGIVTMLGWQLTYHTLRSKGSRPGFPDRVLIRERVVFVELKREGGKPSDEQVRWLTGLATAGAEVYLWRPSDIDEIARVVGTRGVFDATTSSLATWGDRWTPGSLWLPSGGRADQQQPLTAHLDAA